MKAKILLIAATGLFAVAAAPAAAQNFSGPRVEARVGWDGTSVSIQDIRDFGGRGNFGSGSTASDVNFGAEAGFDFQTGRIAAGAYVGVDFAESDEPFPERAVTFRNGRNLTVGGRLGYVIAPTVLLYGKAGLSRGRLTTEYGGNATAAQRATFANFERSRDGFHFGGGVEVGLGSLYTRLDYTHTKYDDFTVDVNNELSHNRNQVTAALGYRF